MAARRPPSVCAFCQARRLALSRRRTISTKRRLQTAVVLRPEGATGNLLSDPTSAAEGSEKVTATLKDRVQSWSLKESIDELRETALGLEALWKQRDLRLGMLRRLRNPWPAAPSGKRSSERKSLPILPEANAALVPHAVFRQKVRESVSGKPMRQVLRAQLLRCEYPRDILRIVAFSMIENRAVAENLALLAEPIMRAVYRCRQNVTDPEVLRCLTAIITRFEYANIQVSPQLIFMGLKFAARSRSLTAMQRYLRSVRRANLLMSSNVFRSVIAKFSIGHRGLGEIRNGRWRRRDLLQVLTGFENETHLSPEQQNHLGTFLDRADWQFLHGWVAVLARCRDSESIWREWELWKTNPGRTAPRSLVFKEWGTNIRMTTRTRGDFWFLEQIVLAGDSRRAWEVLEETGMRLSSLKVRVKDKLLESVEHASVWNDAIRDEMIAKYDRDLAKIETALGVHWVRREGGEDGEGQHELFMDQEDALSKLGEDGWKLDDDYGYPWETDPIISEQERIMHNAPVDEA